MLLKELFALAFSFFTYKIVYLSVHDICYLELTLNHPGDINSMDRYEFPRILKGPKGCPPASLKLSLISIPVEYGVYPVRDLIIIPKYLVTFTVGYDQRNNIDAAVEKFSGNFTIVLFHYDGRTRESDQFEWSKRAIHISARKQTKWFDNSFSLIFLSF
ncbi:hypothetical protein L6164_008967 [Bauhinia variegata]|uniref:Uncharacterized protein n=1 Tax=Bauhinia variegata TaxID=167791 RepID=A0ACB9PJT4_BAUVA|nr:hypothetical protein L6164_008967 [Bauhinia variegata]